MAEFSKDIGQTQFTQGPTQGVVDDSVAKAIKFAGDTAFKFAEGRALAELEGSEEYVDEVEKRSDLPVDVDKDLNLTQIARARKQNRMSGGMAMLKAQAAVKKAINQNPYFAEEIRERAREFFKGGVFGGDIFGLTPEEKMQADLAKKEALYLQTERLEAQSLGLTVPQHRQLKQRAYLNGIASSELDTYFKNGKKSSMVAYQGINAKLNTMSLNVLGNFQEAYKKGPITPEEKANFTSMIRTQTALAVQQYRAVAGEGTNQAIIAEINSNADNLIKLIEGGDLESLMKSKSSIMKDVVIQYGFQNYADVALVKQVGGEQAAGWYFQSLGDDKMRSFMRKVHPELAKLAEGDLTNSISGVMTAIVSGDKSKLNEYQRKAFGPIASKTATDPNASQDTRDAGWAALTTEAATESPTQVAASKEFLKPEKVAAVNADPKKMKDIERVYKKLQATVRGNALAASGGRMKIDGVTTLREYTKDNAPRMRITGDKGRQYIFTYKGEAVEDDRQELGLILQFAQTYDFLRKGEPMEDYAMRLLSEMNPKGVPPEEKPQPSTSTGGQSGRKKVTRKDGKLQVE